MSFFDRLFKELPDSIFTRVTSSRIGKLVLLGTEKLDDLETVIRRMLTLRDVDLESGGILDLTGEITRTDRLGRIDSLMRLFIKADGAKRFKAPTIFGMNEIFILIFGDSFVRIDPGWLLRNTATKKLDGLGFFDALGFLDPDHQILVFDGDGFFDATGFLFPGRFIDPAHIEIVLDGPVEDIPIFDGFTEFVEEFSAAGVSNSVNAKMVGNTNGGPSYPFTLDVA